MSDYGHSKSMDKRLVFSGKKVTREDIYRVIMLRFNDAIERAGLEHYATKIAKTAMRSAIDESSELLKEAEIE